MQIAVTHVLTLAAELIPESSLVRRELTVRARSIFALACIADMPEFVADGCFRAAGWAPMRVVRFLRTHAPIVQEEEVTALRAQVLSASDELLIEAIVYLRGALGNKCAAFGTLRFYDLARPRPSLRPEERPETLKHSTTRFGFPLSA
jgi:hypothetical protein